MANVRYFQNGKLQVAVGGTKANSAVLKGGKGKGSSKGSNKSGPFGKVKDNGKANPMSYAEKKALEFEMKMDQLSGPEGFAGKSEMELTDQERLVLLEKGTDHKSFGYAGFLPNKGYFSCKGCGSIMYLWQAKFIH